MSSTTSQPRLPTVNAPATAGDAGARPTRWLRVAGIAGLVVLFALVFTTWLERTVRTAFDSPSLPDHLGAFNDWWFPARWLLILFYGVTNGLDPDWSHILFVPLVSLYFLHVKRDTLLATPRWLYTPGLYLMLAGLIGYAAGIHPIRNDMAQGVAALMTLAGMTLYLFGPGVMRVAWFPLLFLAFTIKIPDRIWSEIALVFQNITATLSTRVLEFLALMIDYDVSLRGTTIEVTPIGGDEPHALNVAEACSGLRSLMTFMVLGTALAFLGERPKWQRAVLLLSILPVTILVNTLRVTIMGLLTAFGKDELAHGDVHTMIGFLMLIPAAGLFVLLGWILNQLFVPVHAGDADGDAADGDAGEAGGEAKKPRVVVRSQQAAARKGTAKAGDASADAPPPIVEPATPVTPGDVARGLGLGIGVALAGFAVYLGVLFALRAGWGKAGGAALTVVGLGIVALATWHVARRFASLAAGHGRVFGVCVVGAMLATTAAAQGTVIRMTKLVLIKDAVPLRHDLDQLPQDLGDWTLVRRDPRLGTDTERELGTTQYITWHYEDIAWDANEPGAIVTVHIPYYTGTIDTVPHVPERCFTGAGLEPRGRETVTLTLDLPGGTIDPETGDAVYRTKLEDAVRMPATSDGAARINATRFTYADPNTERSSHVFYFFAANGRFLPTPDHVRAEGFDPTDQFSYYCKIEVRVPFVDDADASQARVEAFLAAALPEIMACLPDWADVQAGRWPLDDDADASDADPAPLSLLTPRAADRAVKTK